MTAVGISSLRCPICSADLEVPVSTIPYERQSGPTMYLSFDLAQVRDHIAEHDLGSAIATELPFPTPP